MHFRFNSINNITILAYYQPTELRGAIGAENRDAEGVEGVGNGEGVSPSPAD